VARLPPPAWVPAEPELMITFDVSSVDRLGVLADRAAGAGELIVLDHHASNPGFGTINLIDPAAADTGSFRFSAGPAVHRLAARLLETGIDAEAIARELWDTVPFGYLHVLAA